MHLYRGSTEQFISDAVRARLAGKLADRFFEGYRYRPAPTRRYTRAKVIDMVFFAEGYG